MIDTAHVDAQAHVLLGRFLCADQPAATSVPVRDFCYKSTFCILIFILFLLLD